MKIALFESSFSSSASNQLNEFIRDNKIPDEDIISVQHSVKKYWCGPSDVIMLTYKGTMPEKIVISQTPEEIKSINRARLIAAIILLAFFILMNIDITRNFICKLIFWN